MFCIVDGMVPFTPGFFCIVLFGGRCVSVNHSKQKNQCQNPKMEAHSCVVELNKPIDDGIGPTSPRSIKLCGTISKDMLVNGCLIEDLV
jgi:hypothetical protein